MGMSHEDVRDLLMRAQEIQDETEVAAETTAEAEALIEAAADVGIERRAVERALRERYGAARREATEGELVFAKSVDGKYYVAKVTSAAEGGLRVGFLGGGERDVTADEVRPCSFLPGERVVCPWPWWGPWTCTVLAYRAESGRITVSDGWGETRDFGIGEVWLSPPSRQVADGGSRTRVYVRLMGVGMAIGATMGAVITALLLG